MDETVARYRRLDPQKIVETVQALQARVEDRFPGSGLGQVVGSAIQAPEPLKIGDVNVLSTSAGAWLVIVLARLGSVWASRRASW